MINDSQLSVIRKKVARYKLTHRPQSGEHPLEGLDPLCAQLDGELLPPLPPDELRIAVAVCLLGPGLSDGPTVDMVNRPIGELIKVEPTSVVNRTKRAAEFTIAYGCGKWRQIVERPEARWYGVWQLARDSLVIALAGKAGPIRLSNLWMSKTIKTYPRLLSKRDYASLGGAIATAGVPIVDRIELVAHAGLMADRLIHPEKNFRVRAGGEVRITCSENCVSAQTDGGGTGYYSEAPAGANLVWRVAEGDAEITVAGVSRHVASGTRLVVSAKDSSATVSGMITGGFSLKAHERATIRPTGPGFILCVFECTCGTKHCESGCLSKKNNFVQGHSLRVWDPSRRVSLWAFLASAINGPNRNIQTGSFERGMYFAYLTKEGWTECQD